MTFCNYLKETEKVSMFVDILMWPAAYAWGPSATHAVITGLYAWVVSWLVGLATKVVYDI